MKTGWLIKIVLGFTLVLALAFVFVFLVLLFPGWFSFQPTFRDNVAAISSILVALGTSILALATFKIVQSNSEQESHDRRERLLDKVVDWATEINSCGLNADAPDYVVARGMKAIRAHTLLKYGVVFSRNDYIKSIVEGDFNKELAADVDRVIFALTAFMFLERKSLGIDEARKGFAGTALNIIKEVEEMIGQGATVDDLTKRFAHELASAGNALLIKAGKLTASLAPSG